MKKGGCIFILFAVFWSTLTLVFDGFIVRTIVRQVLALQFATTQGMVLSSEVTHHSDGDGSTHGVSIKYSYQVAGVNYTGDNYRFDKSTSSDSSWARQAVHEHPINSMTTVYYNPRNPSESVLHAGLEGSDLFMAMFITPFNAVMLGFVWAGCNRLIRRWRTPEAGGVRVITELRVTRARLTEYSPLAAGIAVAALLAFISVFPIAFLLGGFHPSLRVMYVAWAIVLSGAAAAALWHWARILSGKYDLVIDTLHGSVRLPVVRGRKMPKEIRTKDVHAAFVEMIVKPGSETTTYSYCPTIRLTSADGPTEKLAEWFEEERARAFVVWLNQQLGVRSPITHERRNL